MPIRKPKLAECISDAEEADEDETADEESAEDEKK